MVCDYLLICEAFVNGFGNYEIVCDVLLSVVLCYRYVQILEENFCYGKNTASIFFLFETAYCSLGHFHIFENKYIVYECLCGLRAQEIKEEEKLRHFDCFSIYCFGFV